jgi:hypothetical protein
MMVVLSVVAVMLTSCGNVSNTNSAVTAKVVVEESVAAMENMMALPTPASQANVIGPQYSILPNWEVNYDQIRKDLVGSAAMTMYTAEYLVKNDILKEGKTYIDSFTDENEGSEIAIKCIASMENTNEGVQIKMNMHEGDSMTDILLDFHYDYNAKQPTESIFAQFAEEGVLVTLFNYKTNEAVEFWLVVDSEMNETFKKSIEEKNMSFDKFSEYGISEYTIAKGDFKVQNIEAYKYSNKITAESSDKLETPVEEETVTDLFNDVYAQVKDYCKSPEVMDSTNAENRVFYKDMFSYAMYESYTLAGLQLPEGMPETKPE